MTPRKASSVAREHAAVAAIRSSGAQRVKVAVSDVDGVLRGNTCIATSSWVWPNRRPRADSASATWFWAGT